MATTSNGAAQAHSRLRRMVSIACVVMACWYCLYMLLTIPFEWFSGSWRFWMAWPFNWVAFVWPLAIVPVLLATLTLAFVRVRRWHFAVAAACLALSAVTILAPGQLHWAGSRLYFAVNRARFEREVERIRSGGSQGARAGTDSQAATPDYVAFTMAGFLDNLTGLVYIDGDLPALGSEFVDATMLVHLKPLSGRWYYFATT